MTDESWVLVEEAMGAGGHPTPPDGCRESFDLYLDLVRRWNPISGLTTIVDETSQVVKHICDSLALLPLLHAATPSDEYGADCDESWLADVGTGAGLPGIPCMIASPRLRFWLVDKDSLKRRFLTTAVSALSLSALVAARLDDCFHSDDAPAPAIRVSRALAAPGKALELCAPKHLPVPGRVFLMLGPSAEDEMEQIRIATEHTSLRQTECLRYHLPLSAGNRMILSFTGIGP